MKTRILEKIIKNFNCETPDDFKEIISYLKDQKIDLDTSKELLGLTSVICEDDIEEIYSSNNTFLKNQFIKKHDYAIVKDSDMAVSCLTKTFIEYKLDDNLRVNVDFRRKQVLLIKEASNSKVPDSEFIVIDAVPVSVKVRDTDFLNLPARFNITWESFNRNSLFNLDFEEYVSISQIQSYLVDAGLVLNKVRLSDAITGMVNCCISCGFAEMKTMIDNTGVYFDKELNYLITVNLNTSTITHDEFNKCKDILNHLKTLFDEKILTTIIKWSMMSIFSFAMKQKKYQLPYLYLNGASDSGKTTLGRICMYLYQGYNENNDISGDSASSTYRFGKALSKNCNYVIINEPYDIFKKPETKELFKNSVESLISRKTHDGVYPAFAPVMFAANNFVPEEDAIFTRLYVLYFGKVLRKDKKEWKEIYNELQISDAKNSILNNLQCLGRFAIQYILKHPDLLTQDWMNTADKIMQEFFINFDEACPRWLLNWAEQENNLEDLEEHQIENIRSVLIRELSKARGQVKIMDNEYGTVKEQILEVYDDQVSTSAQFETLFWDIFNERKVEWLIPYSSKKNPQALVLGQPFKNLINKNSDEKYTIKTLSQLLGWNIQKVIIDNKRKPQILVSLKDFMEFVYP